MFKLSKNAKDITGFRSGKLIAIEPIGLNKKQQVMWLCKCDCGNEHTTDATNITRNRVKSCGCSKQKDLTGMRFGRLIAIKKTGKRRNKAQNSMEWECLCDCGKTHYVSAQNLQSPGGTKSCGCLFIDFNFKHGLTGTKEYRKNLVLKANYGVSLEWYNKKLKEQNNVCAICFLPSGNKLSLAVDHDHNTGVVRELLCSNCNTALGGFKDNIDLLYKAIQYLIKHKTPHLHEVA